MSLKNLKHSPAQRLQLLRNLSGGQIITLNVLQELTANIKSDTTEYLCQQLYLAYAELEGVIPVLNEERLVSSIATIQQDVDVVKACFSEFHTNEIKQYPIEAELLTDIHTTRFAIMGTVSLLLNQLLRLKQVTAVAVKSGMTAK